MASLADKAQGGQATCPGLHSKLRIHSGCHLTLPGPCSQQRHGVHRVRDHDVRAHRGVDHLARGRDGLLLQEDRRCHGGCRTRECVSGVLRRGKRPRTPSASRRGAWAEWGGGWGSDPDTICRSSPEGTIWCQRWDEAAIGSPPLPAQTLSPHFC